MPILRSSNRVLRSIRAVAGLALAALTGALAGALAGGPAASAAVGLVPHRAVYDLGLDRTRADSPVVGARGRLEFEWGDVCDGWTVSQRTHLAITRVDGGEVETVWSINSWEAKDGLRYRFYIRSLDAGGNGRLTVGSAELEGPGLGGQVVYRGAENRRLTLPEGTLFPSTHSFELMALAEQGDFPVWRVVFDGFDDEELFGVNATLESSLGPDTPTSIESELLAGQPSWRVRLAFFPLTRRTPEPQREQAFRFFANGVVDELFLDYGDFTIVASLEELALLPDPGC